jgi:hypothetical protein
LLLQSGPMVSVVVVSSTYFYRSFQSARRSFIMIRKRIWPKTVPWGTPPLRICHSDTQWGILTHWLRRVRKRLIQFVINDGTSISDNLLRRMLWSIWSKALEKSNKKFSQRFSTHQFRLISDGVGSIMHVLLRSFLGIQIDVYRSSHQSTPSASLRQNVHTFLTKWQ